MQRIRTPFGLLSALFITSAGLATAQAQGTAFTYQGRLTSGANAANGVYDFRFKLFLDQFGDTQAGSTVLTNAVPVTDGLFTVLVDFGAGIFAGTSYWLEVDVRTNGPGSYTGLNPLQPVSPSPYSIFSESAATATTAATANAVATNAVGATAIQAGAVSGSQIAAGQVVKSLIVGGKSLYDNVTLQPGNNVTISQAANAVTIAAAGGTPAWSLTGNAGTPPPQNFLGTTDDQPLELWVNSGRAFRLEPDLSGDGAPNVIGGASANVVSNGVVGATIAGGGRTNVSATGLMNVNVVAGNFGTVGGGFLNVAGGSGTVGGGQSNSATNTAATVGGGEGNTASGSVATVGGGQNNSANNTSAAVAGGFGNTASGDAASVGGGYNNAAMGDYAAVVGGYQNTASGEGSFVGGGGSCGYGYGIPGANVAAGFDAFVGGGYGNASGNLFAAVTGGFGNLASGQYGAVGGGSGNTASGTYATVGGGSGNQATNECASVPGGSGNIAGGMFSFAAGQGAQALNPGSFVWSDSTGSTTCTSNNQFMVRASGGVIIYAGSGGGSTLPTGKTAWQSLCDRNAKKNFQPVDTVAVLENLAAIPIQQWNYKWETDTDVPNIGPMAQDFKQAFYPGRDDKVISTLEFDGVELAAIQGLNRKLEAQLRQRDTEIQALKERLERIEKLLAQSTASR